MTHIVPALVLTARRLPVYDSGVIVALKASERRSKVMIRSVSPATATMPAESSQNQSQPKGREGREKKAEKDREERGLLSKGLSQ